MIRLHRQLEPLKPSMSVRLLPPLPGTAFPVSYGQLRRRSAQPASVSSDAGIGYERITVYEDTEAIFLPGSLLPTTHHRIPFSEVRLHGN